MTWYARLSITLTYLIPSSSSIAVCGLKWTLGMNCRKWNGKSVGMVNSMYSTLDSNSTTNQIDISHIISYLTLLSQESDR